MNIKINFIIRVHLIMFSIIYLCFLSGCSATGSGKTGEAYQKRVGNYYTKVDPGTDTLDLNNYLEFGRMNLPPIKVLPDDIVYVPGKENIVRKISECVRNKGRLFGIFKTSN